MTEPQDWKLYRGFYWFLNESVQDDDESKELCRRRGWLEGDYMRMYVRVTKRWVHDVKHYNEPQTKQLRLYYDIANVSHYSEETMGKGIYSCLLTRLEKLPINIYIENVFSKRHIDYYKRRGYKVAHNPYRRPGEPACLFARKSFAWRKRCILSTHETLEQLLGVEHTSSDCQDQATPLSQSLSQSSVDT